jgi:hypothetical protein
MTRSRKWFSAVLALAALMLAAGCEKRPTGFDPNPNMPEGATSADVKLVTYRNVAWPVLVLDTESGNTQLVGASAFDGPEDTPLLLVLDGTPSNTFEMYRRDDGGRFVRTTDFLIQSKFKFVNFGFEEFFSPDLTPSHYSPPTYLARGLLDGVATHASPLSNESRMGNAVPDFLPITYNGNLQPLDSLFTISWIGVPGAVGYWIHVFELPIPSAHALLASLPAPLAYKTAGDLLIGFYAGNNPGGSIQYRLGDPLFRLKMERPLLGHDYYVRITGVDESGQVVAQTAGDLANVALTADLASLLPPDFPPDKSRLFFFTGGARVTRRHLSRGDASVIAGGTGESATAVSHIADLRFPVIRPLSRRSKLPIPSHP